MALNDKDFSGFDQANPDEQLRLIWRLLCHIETEIDKLKKLVAQGTQF